MVYFSLLASCGVRNEAEFNRQTSIDDPIISSRVFSAIDGANRKRIPSSLLGSIERFLSFLSTQASEDAWQLLTNESKEKIPLHDFAILTREYSANSIKFYLLNVQFEGIKKIEETNYESADIALCLVLTREEAAPKLLFMTMIWKYQNGIWSCANW